MNAAYPELDTRQRECQAIKELVSALPASQNTLIWELNNRPPPSFSDAVETIQRYCELNTSSSRINRISEEDDPLKKLVEAQSAAIEKLMTAQAELTSQMANLTSRISKPRSIKCYKCQKDGHIARNCPEKNPGNEKVRQE